MKENTNLSNIIAGRIKQVRRDSDMTQEQMAETLGVSRSTLANWESGTREPNAGELVNFCKIFMVTLDYMCGRSDSSTDINAEKYDFDMLELSPLGRSVLHQIYKIFKRTVPFCALKNYRKATKDSVWE